MIETIATVIAHKGKTAHVVSTRQSPCGSCKKQGQCASKTLAQLSDKDTLEFHVSLLEPVHVGQTIRVGIPEQDLLRSTLVLYGLPLAGLLMGVITANAFVHDSDFFAMIGSCIGLTIGLVGARWLANNHTTPAHQNPRHLIS